MPDFPLTYDPSALLASTSAVPGPTPSGTGHDRLSRAAVQFESVLLGQWLQSAESSFATVPGGDQEEDAGGAQMMSFAMQQLAGSIAASGGLGIARLVERGLEKAQGTAEAAGPSSHVGDASRDQLEGAPRAKPLLSL